MNAVNIFCEIFVSSLPNPMSGPFVGSISIPTNGNNILIGCKIRKLAFEKHTAE